MGTRVKAIITGATGMVGEGVLHECLKVLGLAMINCVIFGPENRILDSKDIEELARRKQD